VPLPVLNERYFTGLLSLAYMAGLHWFQYTEQPLEGRALDGENCNCALVTLTDEPWSVLMGRMRELNPTALAVQAAGPTLQEAGALT
jgi:hypothetical protein